MKGSGEMKVDYVTFPLDLYDSMLPEYTVVNGGRLLFLDVSRVMFIMDLKPGELVDSLKDTVETMIEDFKKENPDIEHVVVGYMYVNNDAISHLFQDAGDIEWIKHVDFEEAVEYAVRLEDLIEYRKNRSVGTDVVYQRYSKILPREKKPPDGGESVAFKIIQNTLDVINKRKEQGLL